MRLMLAIVAVVVGCGLVVAAAYANGGIFGFRWWSWHQKLTVAVQMPNGPKTASAVSEASWEMPPEWFRIGDSGGGHGAGKLKGEAVVLNLGEKKYLFVLLKGYSAEMAIKVFAEPPLKTDNRREYGPALDRIPSVRETRELSRDQYPLLVTFDDINDPTSVKKVDPSNLEAAFGPGYRLNSITMTITDEPVTKGKVKSLLRWLSNYYSRHLDGNRIETINSKNRFANSLASGDFDTEKY